MPERHPYPKRHHDDRAGQAEDDPLGLLFLRRPGYVPVAVYLRPQAGSQDQKQGGAGNIQVEAARRPGAI